MGSIHSFYEELAAGRGGPLAGVLRPFLHAASLLYRGAFAARNAGYDRRPAWIKRIPVPVISVGNITTGGTGKTPVVIDIIARLHRMGKRPAVVCRGYKSGRGSRPDELMLIERSAPGTVCVAEPDRVSGARLAVTRHGAEVIVLDDAFQHRRIARDLDIVVIDATRPFGLGHLIPRGYLREPIGNLARADVLIITRTDQVAPNKLADLQRRLRSLAGDKPMALAAHKAQPLQPLACGSSSPEPPEQGPAYLLSGIGNHGAFRRTASDLGITICGQTRFGDHHRYGPPDVQAVSRQAIAAGARFVLVTEKDAVKLEALAVDWPVPVWVLPVRVDFSGDGGTMMDGQLAKVMEVPTKGTS